MVSRIQAFGILALVLLITLMPGCTTPQQHITPQPPANISVPQQQGNSSAPQPQNNTNVPQPQNNATGNLSSAGGVVGGNNRFAIDLYSQYSNSSGNIFFAPSSIYTALAMTYEGANGSTASEMASVMHLPVNDSIRRSGFAYLIQKMNSNGELKNADAIWVAKDQPMLDAYLQDIQDNFGGGANQLDFNADPEGSRLTINDWVQNETNDKIQNLIPAGLITQGTKLVLTNAVYFKGQWARQFNETFTEDAVFHKADNTIVTAKLMHDTNGFDYMENDKIPDAQHAL